MVYVENVDSGIDRDNECFIQMYDNVTIDIGEELSNTWQPYAHNTKYLGEACVEDIRDNLLRFQI